MEVECTQCIKGSKFCYSNYDLDFIGISLRAQKCHFLICYENMSAARLAFCDALAIQTKNVN